MSKNSSPIRSSIVTDLGFGDSGKGITVDYLCSKAKDPKRTLVIRVTSGHQVGHTVEVDGFRHMISNFGSGTLRGIPTWYSENTTFYPPNITKERKILERFIPQLYLSPLAMVATPYDIAWNHVTENSYKHGSTGAGYGTTVVRNKANVTLLAKDLDNEWIFREKLKGIAYYYEQKIKEYRNYVFSLEWTQAVDNIKVNEFISDCLEARRYWRVKRFSEMLPNYDELIFEGNQGIVLDKHDGIYPHTTWAECTSEKAVEFLCSIKGRKIETPEIYYVTRCYQTRHGNGPMSKEGSVDLVNAEGESNTPNHWQGVMRISEVDPSLLKWSLDTDRAYRDKYGEVKENLVITCLDQRPSFDPKTLIYKMGFEGVVLGSYSPNSKDFKILNK